ncbi:hypothetical protein LJC26_08870, partial [Desulfovibrio sp. OttesenSCG-928-O18]|nr:hypothetical protein [Desulfovibrio sp. OttesenSCG-928-O18]
SREDEAAAARALENGSLVVLARGWEIIPVENLLAHAEKNPSGTLALEAATPEEARLAAGILEKGVDAVVVPPEAVAKTAAITTALAAANAALELLPAEITEITPVGMGHRVCVDTLSRFTAGQGMLVGNSAREEIPIEVNEILVIELYSK